MTPHEWRVRVYYENTDFSGRVFHAEYLRFMERARTEFLRDRGVIHQDLLKEGLFFVISHMEISFHGSATVDDEIVAKTQLRETTGATVTLEQNLFCENRLIIQSIVKLAVINRSGRPVRWPSTLKKALSS